VGWIDLIRSLGGSLIEVFRAEIDAFKEELARSGHHLWIGLAFLGGALVLLFWTLGALIFTLGAVLAIWLQVWAAALIVFGVFAAAAALAVWLGLRRLQQFENPLESLREHIDDHLDWWQHSLLREERPIEVPPAADAYRRDIP